MKKKYFYKRIIGAYLLAILGVGYLLFTTFINMESANRETVAVKQVLDRRLLFENLHNKIRAIETGERGYVITGDEDFLDDYYKGMTGLRKDTNSLRKLQTIEPAIATAIDSLQLLISKKITLVTNLVDVKRRYGYDSVRAIILQKKGKLLSDKIDTSLSSLEGKDMVLLQEANEKRAAFAKAISQRIFLLAVVFMIILLFTYYTIDKDFNKLSDAEILLKYNASLIRNISDPILTTDIQNRVTNWNFYAEQLYGYKEEEVLGKDVFSVFRGSANNRTEELFDLTSGKDTWKGEMIQQHKNGSIIYTDLSISSIKNDDDKNVGSVYVVRDISKRKTAELQLQKLTVNLENEVATKVAELNTVFDRITDAFIALDNDWNYTYVNKKAAELHGKSMEALLGKNIWNENPDVVNEPFYHALQEAKSTNQSIRIELYYSTFDCWFEDLIYPSPDGVSVYYHDITERKKVQNELKEAEEKFRTLVEYSMVGVYIIQGDRFIYINPVMAQMAGYSVEEVLAGKSILDFIYKDDHQVVMENIQSRLKGNLESMNYEMRGVTKGGKLFNVEVFGSVIQYKGKTAILGTLVDISDRKKSMAMLEASENALKISNERFLLVAKATNDAVWDWNMLENNIWGNEVFSALFGLSVGDLIPFDQFLERMHPKDKEYFSKNIQASIDAKESNCIQQFRMYAADDNMLIFKDRANIIYNESGSPVRMLGAMTDITLQKKNEDLIILEKKLSDTLIDSLPGIFYLFNTEGKFYRWNKNFLDVTGYSNGEMSTLHPADLFNDDEKASAQATINNVFTHGKDDLEAGFRCKDGSTIPYFFNGRIIRYQGELCLLGVGIDISEKVKSQQQLLQSEEKYRTIIEQASDGIFISNIEGEYLDVNSRGSKLTGYSREELLQKTVFDLMEPKDVEKYPSKIAALLNGEVVINERNFVCKNGSFLEVEISAQILADGRILSMVRDITERKKIVEALKTSEHKYRLLFEQNPMPMWMLSIPQRQFLDVNKAAIDFYGYSKKEFLKMTAYDIRPVNEIDTLKNYPSEGKMGIHHAGIWTHQKKDSSLVQMDVLTHDIFYEGADARLILVIDVTEKIKAEVALQQSREEFRELATHLEKVREMERTHIAREIHDELGQQLTGLKMDISWLNKRIKSEDVAIKTKIAETITLIDTTVKTVRRISTALRPSILDDLGLVAAMEWQSEDFEKRSEIICNFSSNVSIADVEPDVATGIFRIYQECLTNVLRHAAATKLTSFLQIKDNLLVLHITDDGQGFLINEIGHKKTLGLLGMKERALLMGGSYEITSNPGKGTSVIIIVPLNKSN